MTWFLQAWRWVKNNVALASLLFAVISGVSASGWALYSHFGKPYPAPAATIQPPPGGMVVMTLEDFEARLRKREEEVRAQLAQAGADPEARRLQEAEAAALRGKLENLQAAYEAAKKEREETRKALDALRDGLAPQRLAEADKALVRGDTRAAEALFREVFAKEREQAAASRQRAAEAAYRLARLAEDRIAYREAWDHYRQAVDLAPDNSLYLNDAAALAWTLALYAEAEPLMKRALEIDEKALGPDHPKVAIRLNNLARLYQDTNRLKEAEPLMKRALEIFTQALGPDHPNTQIVRENLEILRRR